MSDLVEKYIGEGFDALLRQIEDKIPDIQYIVDDIFEDYNTFREKKRTMGMINDAIRELNKLKRIVSRG